MHPPLPDVFVPYQTKAGAADLSNKTNVKVSDESCRYERFHAGPPPTGLLWRTLCLVSNDALLCGCEHACMQT